MTHLEKFLSHLEELDATPYGGKGFPIKKLAANTEILCSVPILLKIIRRQHEALAHIDDKLLCKCSINKKLSRHYAETAIDALADIEKMLEKACGVSSPERGPTE